MILTMVEESSHLPELVRRYLGRTLPARGSTPVRVRLRQEGEMWQKAGGRALRFTAVQELSTREVAFLWRARFSLAPLLALHVRDGYTGGRGELVVRLGRVVPLQRVRGPEVDVGEAMRYLSELPWVPQAMSANRALEWRELDAHTVEVATKVGPRRVAVQLEFGDDADIAATYAEARPRLDGKKTVPTPWRGSFAAYETLSGIRLPTRGEVRWELPQGPFTYWRGSVTSVDLEPVAIP